MQATFRIKRVFRGLLSFAEVSVRAIPAAAADVRVLPEVTLHEPWRVALEQGVRIGLDAHAQAGGAPAAVEVVALVEVVVDTVEDAVRCAAAAATWKALGHAEDTIDVRSTPTGLRVDLRAGTLNPPNSLLPKGDGRLGRGSD
jgi:hypothetical protein